MRCATQVEGSGVADASSGVPDDYSQGVRGNVLCPGGVSVENIAGSPSCAASSGLSKNLTWLRRQKEDVRGAMGKGRASCVHSAAPPRPGRAQTLCHMPAHHRPLSRCQVLPRQVGPDLEAPVLLHL